MLQNNENIELSGAEIPSWLNEGFFTDIVEKEFHLCADEYTIRLTSVSNPVGNGENYSSDLYRVKIDIHINNNNEIYQMIFIIKAVRSMMKKMGHLSMYYKEMELYSRILPGFENEWHLIGERVQFSPKFYPKHIVDQEIISMEDLRAKNFIVCDRFKGLDVQHCTIFFEKLAKFHATSMVYYEKFGNYGDKFHESFFRDEAKAFFDSWMDSTLPMFIEVIENHPPISKYAEKIKTWVGKSFLELKMITNPQYNTFNVLNHGDCWTNNLLFSYDDKGEPIDVIFIDYQNPTYSPPAMDIFYFFVSSVGNEYKDTAFDHLVEVYHNSLVANLKKLNYTKRQITLRELHIDLIQKGLIAPMCAHAILSVAKYHDDGKNPGASLLLSDSNSMDFKRKVFNNPTFLTAMEHTLPFLDRRGFLDLSPDYLPSDI